MKQAVARRSLTRGASQARRLLADTHLSVSVTEATTELAITAQVKRAVALEDFRLGALIVRTGEHFTFVASKFTGLYYIVLERNGAWVCSSRDERVAAAMIVKVKALCIQRNVAA